MACGIFLDQGLNCLCVCLLSHFNHVRLFSALWTIAHQAPVHGFSRQEQLIFPEQGSNPCLSCLLHWQVGPLPLVSLRSPFISVKVLVCQSCLTLCSPMDCGPPVSSAHGILQARTLDWVAMPFSRGSSQPRGQTGSPVFQADLLV